MKKTPAGCDSPYLGYPDALSATCIYSACAYLDTGPRVFFFLKISFDRQSLLVLN